MPNRILVVDDEAHIVQVLSLKLRNAGYAVLTAVDGEEGLEIATRDRPELIITDFSMPYMTGLELCEALLRQDETAGIPVVILTARGYALGDEARTLANIRAVISKPFSPRAILGQVQSLLPAAGAETGAPGGDADDMVDVTAAEDPGP
jgi:CheY-like chemotaxis protein